MSYWDEPGQGGAAEHWSRWTGRRSRATRSGEALAGLRDWWADVRSVSAKILRKLRG